MALPIPYRAMLHNIVHVLWLCGALVQAEVRCDLSRNVFSDCHVGTSIAEKSLETKFSLFKLALPKETVNDPEGWNCRGYPYVYHKNG
jgi:hypothetical protein